jgi:hypothetical protein
MKLRRLILAAAAAAWAGSATAQTVSCIMDLDINDQDPAGTNVRASPGGPIIAALKARNRWVQVEVSGQAIGPSGAAWARITSAKLQVDEHGNDEGAALWEGVGWVAFSKLGIGYFYRDTPIRAAPDWRAKIVLSFKSYRDSQASPPEAILGCDGGWLKVSVKGVVGWADNWCDNRLSNPCSSM